MKLQVTNSPNPPRCPWSVIHCSNHFCSASNKIRFKVKDIALGLILKVTFFWNSKMSAYWLAGCFVYLNPISRNISVIPWLYSVSALKKEKVFITHKVSIHPYTKKLLPYCTKLVPWVFCLFGQRGDVGKDPSWRCPADQKARKLKVRDWTSARSFKADL